MAQAPFRHDRATTRDDAGDPLGRHRDIGQSHPGVDREVIDALFSLLDQRVAEDLPGQVFGDAADLLQRLIDRYGTDRYRRIADDPFARVVDVAPCRQVHDRVRTPADRPHQLVDLGRDVGRDRGIADVRVDLDEEIAADRHRFGFGVVDVAGDYRPAACDLAADEFGRDEIGDLRTEILAVADMIGDHRPADILARGDIFHFRRNDSTPGIVHLADIRARLGTQGAADDVRKGPYSARPVGTELTVILRLQVARGVCLDIAAAHDPRAAQLRQASIDIDHRIRVGVGTRRVVDVERCFAA